MTVYGRIEAMPIPEIAYCTPISYYGIAKYAAKRYVHALRACDGIFLGNVLREEPLTIFGDGTQSRDFVYIDDVVEAWSRALAAPATFGQVFNLGSAHGLAINELTRQVLAVCRRPSTADVIRRAPARSGEQRHVEADIARIRKALSWQPTVPFEVGLRKTYEWAESRRAG